MRKQTLHKFVLFLKNKRPRSLKAGCNNKGQVHLRLDSNQNPDQIETGYLLWEWIQTIRTTFKLGTFFWPSSETRFKHSLLWIWTRLKLGTFFWDSNMGTFWPSFETGFKHPPYLNLTPPKGKIRFKLCSISWIWKNIGFTYPPLFESRFTPTYRHTPKWLHETPFAWACSCRALKNAHLSLSFPI